MSRTIMSKELSITGCVSGGEAELQGVKRIPRGFILPSAAFTIKLRQVKRYRLSDTPPRPGDVVYGVVSRIGEHSSLENASGRIHQIHDGTKAVFVFGNRYAPDYYEGLVPDKMIEEIDLLTRSGMVGLVKTKNTLVKDPTKVRVLGYVPTASRRQDVQPPRHISRNSTLIAILISVDQYR